MQNKTDAFLEYKNIIDFNRTSDNIIFKSLKYKFFIRRKPSPNLSIIKNQMYITKTKQVNIYNK